MVNQLRRGRFIQWEKIIATLPFEDWNASVRVYYVRTRGRKNRQQDGAGTLVDRIVRRKGCKPNLRGKVPEQTVTESVFCYFENKRNQ